MCRSRRDFRKLIDVGLAGGEERGDDPAALVGEQPAVRAANFIEQVVRAQQRQASVDMAACWRCSAAVLLAGYSRPRRSRLRRPASANSPRLTAVRSAASSLAHGLSAR